jgi:hypothetical protein
MSTTSNQMGSRRLFPFFPKRTSSYTLPKGVHECPGMMPWKVSRLGFS